MKTIFLRALEADNKEEALLAAIRDPLTAQGKQRFEVDPADFAAVPRSPFAYWVSEKLRRVFGELPAFSEQHLVTRGAYTTNDFRFYRLAWEVEPVGISATRSGTLADKLFVLLAKGGSWSPYYHDVHLVIRWDDDGAEAKAYLSAYRQGKGWGTDWSACLNGYGYYFRPGLTWPRRTTSRLAMRAMPGGCIFTDKGPAAFVTGDDSQELLSLLAITNSRAFGAITELQLAAADAAARSYEVGIIQRTPVPKLTASNKATLAALAHDAWSQKRSLDTRNEISHAFILPALLQVGGETLADRAVAWSDHLRRIEAELATIQAAIDARCFDLYNMAEADRHAAIEGFVEAGVGDENDPEADSDADVDESADIANLIVELVSWNVGVAFGRFDVRFAIGTPPRPRAPEPIDPLPVCSSGMITGDEGLPLTVAPSDYPLAWPAAGLFVDDPGHADDLTAAVRAVFEAVFGDAADPRWHEAGALLDPKEHNIRHWLAREFFEHHLSRYSKSRRQAPIYWLLSSSGGGYTIWLYYHRFRRDTLFQALNEFAKPKLQHERFKLNRLLGEAGPQPTRSQREAIEAQESFVSELEGFVEDLARVAPLWNPDLNDGVIINYAPLWRMIGHTPWRKSVKQCWDTLCAGDYDWSHLAMHLWPERVVPKCATDRSLAIAHGLEEVFWVEGPDGKWKPRSAPTRPVGDVVSERSSSAVKAALKSLLDAPSPGGSAKRGRRGKSRA